MADQGQTLLGKHSRCGYSYFWFTDCNHTTRFRLHRPSERNKDERGPCNSQCEFDGSENNSQWLNGSDEMDCPLCEEVTVEQDGLGDNFGELYDHTGGDPPEVSNPAQRCIRYGSVPESLLVAEGELFRELYTEVRWDAMRQFALLSSYRYGEGISKKEARAAEAEAKEKERAAALESSGAAEFITRGFRRDRFNDRHARQEQRIRRRQLRWLTRIHAEQRNALHNKDAVSIRPYIIADLQHANANTDLMTSVPAEAVPEGTCCYCRGQLHKMEDDVEAVLVKNHWAETRVGKVLPSVVQKLDVVRLPCQHHFHFECINYGFHGLGAPPQDYRCPVCRMRFSDVRIIPEAIRNRYRHVDAPFQDNNNTASTMMSESTGASGHLPYPTDEDYSSPDDSDDSDDSAQDGRALPASVGPGISTKTVSDLQAEVQRLTDQLSNIRDQSEADDHAHRLREFELATREQELRENQDAIDRLRRDMEHQQATLDLRAEKIQRQEDAKAAAEEKQENHRRRKIAHGLSRSPTPNTIPTVYGG